MLCDVLSDLNCQGLSLPPVALPGVAEFDSQVSRGRERQGVAVTHFQGLTWRPGLWLPPL